MSTNPHHFPSTSPEAHALSSLAPAVRHNQYPPGWPEARSHTQSAQASLPTPAAHPSMHRPVQLNPSERNRAFTPDHPASSLSTVPPPISLRPPASQAPAGFGVNPSIVGSGSSPSTTFAVAAPRSSSLPFSSVAVMGQSLSKSPSDSASLGVLPTSSSHLSSKGFGNAGQKLKRALARRKKVDDAPLKQGLSNEERKQQRPEGVDHAPILTQDLSTSSAPAKVTTSLSPVPASPKRSHQLSQLATQVLNAGKRTAKATLSPLSLNQPQLTPSPLPPPLPPRPNATAAMKRQSPPAPVETSQHHLMVNNRSSIIPISPGISSAINYMRLEAIAQERASTDQVEVEDVGKDSEEGIEGRGSAELTGGQEEPRSEVPAMPGSGDVKTDPDARNHVREKGRETVPSEVKEAWRKSDSSMSYHTIRPGAGSNRSSRPTSVAESLHSNHTVVPAKRLSALIGDADFGMLEEDDSDGRLREDRILTANQQPVASAATKTKNRRSLSLNIGANPFKASSPSPHLSSATEMRSTSFSISEAPPSARMKGVPTLTRVEAQGSVNPSSSATQPSYERLANGNPDATVPHNGPPSNERTKPSGPLSHRFIPSSAPRQPSISMSSTFAPAAGLARKAVEKIGWPWGSHSNSHSISGNTNTGYTSSSSSQASHTENALTRTDSNQSITGIQGMHKLLRPKHKRTPNGTSGSWSIHSNATTSSMDSDGPPPEPSVGRRLRPPLRVMHTGASNGLVFGQNLQRVVRETGIGGRGADHHEVEPPVYLGLTEEAAARWPQARALELRCLPALVVRCAQHLLIWGIQEEGLFRVSGRPAHVAKIRTEFDTGADFDMIECSPGDLDPHAVASVFKAYLRELPEPILTHGLMPYFEAALTQENASANDARPAAPRLGGRGPGLPSGPRLNPGNPPALRKPPSLSTLAMPVMSAARPPSKELINSLTTLVAKLPRENQDLLRTVTDLIKATASQSKETKMPLSNLLLVFCPSLNMNPPLLRALCEIAGIWGDEPDLPDVIDIKRQTLVPGRSRIPQNEETQSIRSGSVSFEEDQTSDLRRSGDSPGPTEDTEDGDSISDAHKRDTILAHRPSLATSCDTPSLQDDSSCVSRTSSTHQGTPSPAFSLSSAESLATPTTSSGGQSIAHVPTEQDPFSKDHFDDEPIIAKDTGLAVSHNVRKLAISDPISIASAPVGFPATQEKAQAPATPLSKRRSIPALSLPGGASTPSSPLPSNTPSPARRMKKPSLQLLFSKRSASSLNSVSPNHLTTPSPYLQTSRSASDTSVSTPNSAVTAPQSSPEAVISVPPQLDTPIESSPGLGLDFEVKTASPGTTTFPENVKSPPSKDPPSHERFETSSKDSEQSVTPSPESATPSNHLRSQPTRGRQNVNNSTTNLLRLSTETEPEEDWTQSVLLAADVEGTWASSFK
ncbi:hypothetical protein AX16_002075 [Volvariella volvacea WC 439]|nr:hypothetical protein AX16_002075 [Volvariella volvacea WC 439]